LKSHTSALQRIKVQEAWGLEQRKNTCFLKAGIFTYLKIEET